MNALANLQPPVDMSIADLSLNINSTAVTVSRHSFWDRRGGHPPKILLVTPELSESRFLARNGNQSPQVKAGGLADVSAMLLDSFSEAGAQVHVALPHFRSLSTTGKHSRRLHLCEDREFCYRHSVYEGCAESNLRAALAFQRDVIHYVLPAIRPDLVHCHDWMTGLIPAAARSMGIPSLFTVHNLHDERTTLSNIEDRGIDAAKFWSHLYFDRYPDCYENTRDHNPLSMLASGILAADHVNTVSPGFLRELAEGGHGAPWAVIDAIRGKLGAGRAHGFMNALPEGYCPSLDPNLAEKYDAANHAIGKRSNKLALQQLLGLEVDADAPVLFWPSRLDPVQKGCHLLAEILYQLVSDYWALGLQVVFVADGPYKETFENIVAFHDLKSRIAVRDFSEPLSRLGYAASDFTLMPSSFEPCGLSQLIGQRHGSLPIVHATGGLRDTVRHLNPQQESGNGFAFEVYDARALRWAVDEAIRFYICPPPLKNANISRVMQEAGHMFTPSAMMRKYLGIYDKLLEIRYPISSSSETAAGRGLRH